MTIKEKYDYTLSELVTLDEMGHIYICVEQMGLDEMGLDKIELDEMATGS